MNLSTKNTTTFPFAQIQSFIGEAGPEPQQYEMIDEFVKQLFKKMETSEEDKQFILNEALKVKTLKDVDSMLGHMLQKPFGYAGDFMIIDKIYQKHLSMEHSGWDKYTHNHTACRAVVNRKRFMKSMVMDHLLRNRPMTFLNIASGPGRDLKELYDIINPKNLKTTCVEIDERAIEHASELCKPYLDQVEFLNRNVLRFNPEHTYDLVWSAGLFDYFNDKTFVRMIRKMYEWVSPGGEMVVGNFSENNPSRALMEVMAGWYLHHRTAEHLTELVVEAGVPREAVSIDAEPLGLNLFVRMKKM